MKRLTAIFLCLCLFVQCTAQVAVLGLFELNKRYIAENLCENRAKPKSSCCGKCYLGKQLNKAGEDESPSGNAPVKTVKIEVMPCVLPLQYASAAALADAYVEPVRTPVLRHLQTRLYTASVFHPPAAGC